MDAPVTGLKLETRSDLDDPRIIRALYLTKVGRASYNDRASKAIQACAVQSVQAFNAHAYSDG